MVRFRLREGGLCGSVKNLRRGKIILTSTTVLCLISDWDNIISVKMMQQTSLLACDEGNNVVHKGRIFLFYLRKLLRTVYFEQGKTLNNEFFIMQLL